MEHRTDFRNASTNVVHLRQLFLDPDSEMEIPWRKQQRRTSEHWKSENARIGAIIASKAVKLDRPDFYRSGLAQANARGPKERPAPFPFKTFKCIRTIKYSAQATNGV
jgi:hypothetical protein